MPMSAGGSCDLPPGPAIRAPELYAAADIEALIRRKTRMRRPAGAAATALDWGLPGCWRRS